jgi:DnaK suppressor protein
MAAKKAATKKRTASGSAKRVVKKSASKSASGRSGKKTARKMPRKPSAKKTVKSAKHPSKKKVAKQKVSAQKVGHKAHGQAKVASKRMNAFKATPVSARSTAPLRPRSSGSVLTGPVRGFKPYQPRRGEDYMSKSQLEHFRQILLAWKRELMEEVDRTMLHMKDDAANFPDPNDRATQESEFGLELRTRDRERKLLKKIDSALTRIDDGSYGYCEETGDEIGLRRLEARPVATLCVEAQERRELAERQFRDREDQYR